MSQLNFDFRRIVCSLPKTEKLHRSVWKLSLGLLVTRPAFFGVLQESAGGLDRGRSGTLQRDSNNVPVTGTEVCSDSAGIRNRVSSQTVTMIEGILGGSSSWRGDKILPDDWEINAAAADWTAQARMIRQKVQNVTFIRGNDTSSACVHVPSRVVGTDLSRKNHTCTQQCRQPSVRWLSSCSNGVHDQAFCKISKD